MALQTGSSGVARVSMFGAQPTDVLNLTSNWFTGYAEREFGLHFSFQLVPAADVATKQDLLLGSGEYPDVIWNGSISQTDALKYGSEGIFISLNRLIRRYAPNVWRTIQTVPGYKQAVTAPNGKIYALPSYDYCPWCNFSNKFYIDLADLSRYHLALPRTTAQFEHVLEVFKQHGLVPLTGTPDGWNSTPITYLMNSFIPYGGPSDYLDVSNGRVLFAPSQPAWRQGLEYIRNLFQQGLVSKVSLTQELSPVQKLIADRDVGVVPAGSMTVIIPNYAEPNSTYDDWLPLPPLRGPKGAAWAALSPSIGGLTFAITKKTSKQQAIRIMRLLNFMYTPRGAQISSYGPPGRYWTPAKKGAEGMVPRQALFATEWDRFDNAKGAQNVAWTEFGPYDESQTWRTRQSDTAPYSSNASTSADTLAQLQEQISMAGRAPKSVYPAAVWVPASALESYATESTNIDQYVTQWTAEFITGEKSLTADWSAYLRGLSSLDLRQYVRTSQRYMGRPTTTQVSVYERNPAQIRYLVSMGPVPPLVAKYLREAGVPSSDFKR